MYHSEVSNEGVCRRVMRSAFAEAQSDKLGDGVHVFQFVQRERITDACVLA